MGRQWRPGDVSRQPPTRLAALVQVDDTALRAVLKRISSRQQELARQVVERYREEIVGYQNADEADLAETLDFVLLNIEALLAGLEGDEPAADELLETAREVAARRAHRGVSLDSMLHQGRLWGQTLWESVLATARLDRPGEREAALEIAGDLWRHVDVVSTAMAYAYLDEMTDRGLLGRDLLDALLGGQGDTERVSRLARMLHRRLGENHVVVLVRADGVPEDDFRRVSLATRATLDSVVEAARTHLRPTAGSLLLGIRQGDVVALYPAASDPDELDAIRRECVALTGALAIDVSIGMSGWHPGRAAIATAYAEAREAVEIAAGTGIRGRAVVLDDVLVDHMLRASPHARRILEETLRPLVEYDRAHRAELVQTLRAYLSAGTNLTQSARLLTVHANTVVYRLRRIRELSGRDPHSMEDLQILFLALKLNELSAEASDGS
jgi:sugar diacid utilization regulator